MTRDQRSGRDDVILHLIVAAVKAALLVAGQVQDRFAQGLARQRARMNRCAAEPIEAIDHSDALTELRGGDRATLPRRPAPDHEEVVVNGGAPRDTATADPSLTGIARSASSTSRADRQRGATCFSSSRKNQL